MDYNEISPGVRDLVREINEVHGIKTCDSGDGSNYKEGMECALPDKHVFMHFNTRPEAEAAQSRLQKLYPEATVQITDSAPDPEPGDFVLLYPEGCTE